MRCEFDFSNLSTTATTAPITPVQLSNIYVLKGWCKQTMSNATVSTGYLHAQFNTLVNIAAAKDNIGGQYLAFKEPWRYFKIEEKFRLDTLVANKMRAIQRLNTEGATDYTRVPTIHKTFKWSMRRKTELEPEHETAHQLRVNSWVPFVMIYSKSFDQLDATNANAPQCHHISRLWFSD